MTIRARKRASLIGAICLSAAALAGAAGAPPMQLNIAAQPIDDALREFGRQSGLQVFLASVEGGGVTASAVNGSYTPAEALQKLLSNTGLRYEYIDERTIAIRPIAPRSEGFQKTSARLESPAQSSEMRTSANVSVNSHDDANTIETVSVFGTLESQLSVGSKSGQSLRETPKSVTIVTHERIEAQNLTSLQEVLVQTTGVAVSAFNPQETFYYSRGIRMNTLQFDGGAPAYTGGFGFFYTPDTATIEQVQVLRGVDGMYSGAGEPGGVINLIRKRPQRDASMRVDLSAGTWDNYRAILDGTGPLAIDGRLRGRAVASYMDRGYHLDRYTTEKQILYGVLEFDATDSTLIAAGLSYETRDDLGFPGWGTPRYSDGTPLGLSREYNPAPRWAHWNSETAEAFARVEQKFGETGELRLVVNQIEQDSDMNYVTLNGAVNPVTLANTNMGRAKSDISSIQRMADLSASGTLELFGRTHRYTVGTDFTKLSGTELTYRVAGYTNGVIPLANFFSYDPATFAEPASAPFSFYPKRERSQRGYYVTVGLQLAEQLRLTLGGRYGKFRYDHALRTLATGVTSYLRYEDEEFIPSAALTYSLSDRWTAYVSYGETFNPQANLLTGPPPGASPLEPILGENLELGIKGDVFQGVTAAASIYQLKREGQGAVDPAYIGITDPGSGASCCYLQQGEIKIQGLDLEMSGQILSGWQLFGGYTFTQTDYVGRATGANVLGRTPKHQGKVWSTYRLPGRFSAVTLNAGVTSQTHTYFGQNIPPVAGWMNIPYGGITLWNASVQYALNDKWTVALYGENLTDKVYMQPTGAVYGQNVYGTPRSLTLSVRGGW